MSTEYAHARIAAGAVILNSAGEILLLLRSKKCRNDQGNWSLPGGKLEIGEKIEETVKRETKEEADLELLDLQLLGYVDHILPDDGQHWVPFIFLSTNYKGEPHNNEPDKCDEMRWFGLDKIPKNHSQVVQDSLELYREYSQ